MAKETEGRTFAIAWIKAASVPIPKFAHPCGGLECELRNQRDTSNSMILVPLLNPKFANALAARRVRTSGSRHWRPILALATIAEERPKNTRLGSVSPPPAGA